MSDGGRGDGLFAEGKSFLADFPSRCGFFESMGHRVVADNPKKRVQAWASPKKSVHFLAVLAKEATASIYPLQACGDTALNAMGH